MALHWSERLLPTVESNMTPALLTRMSILPNSSTALCTRLWACCSSVTSHSTAIASLPSWDTHSTSSSRRSLRRAPATTAAPSTASARTVASPMPLEAPVTTATLPFNLSPMFITSPRISELQRDPYSLFRTVGISYPVLQRSTKAYSCSTSRIRLLAAVRRLVPLYAMTRTVVAAPPGLSSARNATLDVVPTCVDPLEGGRSRLACAPLTNQGKTVGQMARMLGPQ